MKLRKLTATLLALSLTASLAATAVAAETADARLAQVTLAVKSTLDIDDGYTDFYGEPSETPLGTKWDLQWSDDDRSLSVTATDQGKVLGYNRSAARTEERGGSYGPSFPAMTQDEAKAKAEEFLNKVLTQGESAVFNDRWNTSMGLDVSQYGFSGDIYLNGIPTPMSFRVWVWVSDGGVTNFWRDDVTDYVGDIPAAATVTTADAARAQLAQTLELELIYVRDEPGENAVLRYVPRHTDSFYVDAATGKLVNLTELRRKLAEAGSTAGGGANKLASTEAAADTAMASNRLSDAELAGVAKLEGVLSSNELDQKVRAWSELKLSGFELSGCSYSVERPDGGVTFRVQPAAAGGVPLAETAAAETAADTAPNVTARMSYNKLSDGMMYRRTVTVDARTGELKSMSGYNAYQDKDVKIKQAQAQKNAEAFLGKLWGDQFAKTELYDSSDAQRYGDAWYFTFAHKVNGYFFPANTITVRVSAADGAIMGFSKSFDDTVTFDDAQGLIDLDAAKTAWAATYQVELRYIAVPVALDLLGAEVKPLINAGYSWYNSLKPGYQLDEQEVYYMGVDAKTGQPVQPKEAPTPEGIAYDDLAGHWAEAALTELAQYGVGWYTPSAQPDAQLTQIDFVALLCSADGYRYVPGEGGADDLYDYAVRRGLLTKDQRQDDKALTRADMVTMLLDSLGYQHVAGLQGIFTCAYTDAADIPAAHLGYAALAQGLGLVSGDGEGRYAPSRPAVRAEAATMLWKYMKR